LHLSHIHLIPPLSRLSFITNAVLASLSTVEGCAILEVPAVEDCATLEVARVEGCATLEVAAVEGRTTLEVASTQRPAFDTESSGLNVAIDAIADTVSDDHAVDFDDSAGGGTGFLLMVRFDLADAVDAVGRVDADC
jgi:hypothetical protein